MDKRFLAVPVIVGVVVLALVWRDRAREVPTVVRQDVQPESSERVVGDETLAAVEVEPVRAAAEVAAAPTAPTRALTGTVSAYGAPVAGAHVMAVRTDGSSSPPLADDMRAFEEQLATARRTESDAQGAYTLDLGGEAEPWLVFAWKGELLPTELAPLVIAADASEAADIELARFHAVELLLLCAGQPVILSRRYQARVGGFDVRVAAKDFERAPHEWAEGVEAVLGFDPSTSVRWYRANADAPPSMILALSGAPAGYSSERSTHEVPDVSHGIARVSFELRRESEFGAIEIVVDAPDFAERLRASEGAEFDLLADDRQRSLWIYGLWIEGDITTDGARSVLRVDDVPVGTYRLVLRTDLLEVTSHVPPIVDVRAGEVATVRLDLPHTGAVRFMDVGVVLGPLPVVGASMYRLVDGKRERISVREGREVSFLPSGRYVFTSIGPDIGAWAYTPLGRTVPVPELTDDEIWKLDEELESAARAARNEGEAIAPEWLQLVDAIAVDVIAGVTLELRPTRLRAPD